MDGSKTIFSYGVPLEWLQIMASWASRVTRTPGLFMWYLNYEGLAVNYAALILDLAIYFLLAFAIVYGVSKLRATWMRMK
jgi:hypothetical protein